MDSPYKKVALKLWSFNTDPDLALDVLPDARSSQILIRRNDPSGRPLKCLQQKPLVFPCQLPQDLPTFGRLAPRKACATFEGHLRVQMCFVADSSKWRGDVCKACKCSSHPENGGDVGSGKMVVPRLGPTMGPCLSPKIRFWLVIISFLLVLTLYTLDTLETKVGTPQSRRMELRWVFIHGFHWSIGQTRRKKGFFLDVFSLLIPFVLAKPPFFLEIGTILSPWLGRFPLNRGNSSHVNLRFQDWTWLGP